MGGKTLTFYFNDPLEQFILIPLLSNSKLFSWVISNIFIFSLLIFLSIFFVFLFYKNWFFGTWPTTIFLYLYNFLVDVCKNSLNIKVQIFFPFFLFNFLFIFLSNFFGMIPFTFTVTSHFAITFFLALTYFIGLNIVGVKKHGLSFVNIFLPESVSIFIAPLLVLVEFVSYFARVLSLSIRLFANMLAGHALIKILGGFAFSFALTILNISSVFGLISLLLVIFVIIGLELLIAFLQAYVFFLLMIIYFENIISLGH